MPTGLDLPRASARTIAMAAPLAPDRAADAPARGVGRAVDVASLDEATALIATAFDVPAEEVVLPAGAEVWVARAGDAVVSSVVCVAHGDTLHVGAVATPPADRGNDHATTLLRALLGHYALEGLVRADVVATERSAPLFARLGFTPAA